MLPGGNIFMSLLEIPTHYGVDAASGGQETMLIQQVVRQNVRAQMTLPLHTLEWTHLVLLLESPNGNEPESLLAPAPRSCGQMWANGLYNGLTSLQLSTTTMPR